jgi:hypothetical protein
MLERVLQKQVLIIGTSNMAYVIGMCNMVLWSKLFECVVQHMESKYS